MVKIVGDGREIGKLNTEARKIRQTQMTERKQKISLFGKLEDSVQKSSKNSIGKVDEQTIESETLAFQHGSLNDTGSSFYI